MHEICNKECIVVSPEWIGRQSNTTADALSRCGGSDSWSMKFWVFRMLNQKRGPHSVDRFASQLNNKCIRFNSRWWVPGTEAVNAMEESWVGENNWAVPPPRLILNCIRKIENEQADCTLIVPE